MIFKRLAAVLIIFNVFSVFSQNEKLISFIEHYSDSMLTTAQQPGMIISITKGDKVIYEKSKGLADLNTKAPMVTDFRFRIGSLTKTFTCTVVLQLVDEKKLTLDE